MASSPSAPPANRRRSTYDEHVHVIALAVKFAAGKIKVHRRHRRQFDQGGDLPHPARRGSGRGRLVASRALLQQAHAGRPVPAFSRHRANDQTAHPALQHPKPLRQWKSAWKPPLVWRATRSNIVGIKEAGGNVDRVSQLRAALGTRFTILSGDDALTLPFMAAGAEGVVSVASNVIPREISQMVTAARTGRFVQALKLHEKFYRLFKDLFIETNPLPVKAALAMMGMMREEFRLPLVPMNPKNRDVLKATLKACGILK